ncbi:MAG: zf-HC2 domain-containing protein [Lachnospiraceae bacterium]|nr:zf-HC2 domain-containing protein [Lachnospiraceae bacterium]
MGENIDCSVVKDLLPLSLEGLTSDESENLVQIHLQTCKKCRKYREELINEKQEMESSEKENDKRIFRALKRRRYEMIGLIAGILSVLGVILLLWFQPFSPTKNGEEVYPVKEHYEQPADYGNQDYQGIAGLALFPESEGISGNIEEFYYDCKGQKLYQAYQIYLKCSYDKEAYETEKNRLLNLIDESTGRGTVYSEEETFLPCVYAMLYDEGYEYALLDEEDGTIIYIYLQGIDRREVVFRKEYLPTDYGQAGYYFETERDPYRIYQTEWEKMNDET